LASPCTRNFADKFADIQVTYVRSIHIYTETERERERERRRFPGRDETRGGEREEIRAASRPRYANRSRAACPLLFARSITVSHGRTRTKGAAGREGKGTRDSGRDASPVLPGGSFLSVSSFIGIPFADAVQPFALLIMHGASFR